MTAWALLARFLIENGADMVEAYRDHVRQHGTDGDADELERALERTFETLNRDPADFFGPRVGG